MHTTLRTVLLLLLWISAAPLSATAAPREVCKLADRPELTTLLGGHFASAIASPVSETNGGGRHFECSFAGPGMQVTTAISEMRFIRDVPGALTAAAIARRMNVAEVELAVEAPPVIDHLLWATGRDGTVSCTAAFSFRIATVTVRSDNQHLHSGQRKAMRELAEALVFAR